MFVLLEVLDNNVSQGDVLILFNPICGSVCPCVRAKFGYANSLNTLVEVS